MARTAAPPDVVQDPARPAAQGARAASDAQVAARVAATIRDDVRSMHAYAVAKAAGLIKLDAMENPYTLPEAVRERLAAALSHVPVNRYPDGAGDTLKDALRASAGIPQGAGIVLGNGSDEILQMVTTAVARPGGAVVAPDPSFAVYRMAAQFAHMRYVGVSLRPDFALDTDAMLGAIARERPALVWIAYPNNPTGNLFDVAAIERILHAAPGLVAIDEAYYAFADATFLPRALEFDNLIVVRTVSKIGLAGLRLGYAVAHPAWIAEIDKVRPPYNVNACTQAAVPLLLQERALLDGQARAIRAERSRLAEALARLPGVSVYPTQANFVVARVPDAPAWHAALREAGILVKNLHGWHPLLDHTLRITVGTPAENDALIAALQRIR